MKKWKELFGVAMVALLIGAGIGAPGEIFATESEPACNHTCAICNGEYTKSATSGALSWSCGHVHDATCGYNAGGYSYNDETNTYEVDTAGAMQAAIDAAEVSGTTENPAIIKLMANLDLPGVDDGDYKYGVLVTGGVITIDLNGYTLNGADGYYTLQIGAEWGQISNAKVTITDSSNAGTGVISNVNGDISQESYAINNLGGWLIVNKGAIIAEGVACAYGIWNAEGTVIINDGNISASKKAQGNSLSAVISSGSNAAVIMKGGTISAEGSNSNGIDITDGLCTITGGTITSNGYALLIDSDVKLSITGGSFNGGEADIYTHSGEPKGLGVDKNNGKGATFPDGITVENNTLNAILATGAGFYDADGNLLTVADSATSITGTVTVGCAGHTGGTATCVSGKICEICGSAYGELDANNHGAMDPATGKCSNGCGNFLAVASVTTGAGTTYFAELQAAIDAAEVSGTTQKPAIIKLMANLNLPGVAPDLNYPDDKAYGVLIDAGVMKIDLNGFTLRNSDAYATIQIGTDHNEPCGAVVTIMDSSAQSTEGTGAVTKVGTVAHGKCSIINYCGTLFINSGTIKVEGTADAYGVWNTNGKVTVNGGKIYASTTSTKAMASGIYSQGANNPSLTVNGGEISGNGTGGYGIRATTGAVTIKDGTIAGGKYALSIAGGVEAASITGGSFTGSISIYTDGLRFLGIDKNGKGATFPNGITVENGITVVNNTLNAILATGAGFYNANGNLLTVADNATSINEAVTVGCANHTGGTATCAKKAVCTTCGREYGELDANKHILSYSADGGTITAFCTANCGYTGTISISASGKTYDGTAVSATVTNNVDTTDYNSSIVYKDSEGTSVTTPVNAGTYTANLTVGDVTAKVEFTIAPKSITVTADNTSKTYGENDTALTYNVQSGLVQGETLTGALTRESGENAGTYAIIQGTLTNENNPNYDITFVEGTFTINGIDISTATAEQSGTLTYNGKEQTPTFTVTLGNTTLTAEDYDVTVAAQTNASSYTATITGKGNCSGTIADVDWSINKATPTAEMFTYTAPTNLVFDGYEKTATVTTNKVGMGEITVKYSETPVTAGTYTVSIDVEEGDNYNAVSDLVVGEFTIEKATPEVEAVPVVAGRTYDPSATLADIVLSGGTVKNVSGNIMEGTWSWVNSDIVPTVGNAGYEAVFTPEPTAYEETYKSVTQIIPVNVAKATPYIVTNPTATGIYGNSLSEIEISGTASFKGTAVDGYFIWEAENADGIVPGAGSYTEFTVSFLPDKSMYAEVTGIPVTLVINKAANAPDMPPGIMDVSYETETVGSVTLPDGWAWAEEDTSKSLAVGEEVTATAVYNGLDKGNYETETVVVTITRSTCNHSYTSEITKQPTAYEEGEETYTCGNCGHSYTEAIAKLEPIPTITPGGGGGSTGGGYYPSDPVVTPTPVPTAAPTPIPTAVPTSTPTATPVPTHNPEETWVTGEVAKEYKEAEKQYDVLLGTSKKESSMVETLEVGKSIDVNFYGVKNWKKNDYTYKWTSSDESVAVVDKASVVTMLDEGIAIIRLELVYKATGEKLSVAPMLIGVPEAVYEVFLGTSAKNAEILRKLSPEEKVDLNFYGVKNWKKNNYEYQWISSDEEVATVDKTGVVTTKKPGTAIIRLKLKEKATGKYLTVAPVVLTVQKKTEE